MQLLLTLLKVTTLSFQLYLAPHHQQLLLLLLCSLPVEVQPCSSPLLIPLTLLVLWLLHLGHYE
jgi:hypothetical protein